MAGERKGAWIVGAIALWIFVLVVASGPAPDTTTWLGTSNMDTFVQVTLLVLAALGLVVVLFVAPRRMDLAEDPKPRKRRFPIGLLLVFLVLLVWRPDPLEPRESIIDGSEDIVTGDPLSADEAAEGVQPVAELSDLLLIVVVIAVAAAGFVAYGLWRAYGPGPDLSDVVDPGAAHRVAIAAAHGHLINVTDPRSAVLASYAELERALTEEGRPRGSAETPGEYVSRLARIAKVDEAPFQRLGRLYERARFSSLPITVDDQHGAASALEESVLASRVPT